jgi:hypothetical protein
VKVIITGGRNWEGYLAADKIINVLEGLHHLSSTLDQDLQIVHGDCPTGADAIADRWCRRRDIFVHPVPAQWSTYGRAAGPVRNQEMADMGADMCVAFLMPDSRGTRDMIVKAEAAGILTFVIEWDPAWDTPTTRARRANVVELPEEDVT